MAQLAIKGHPTRGKEIINILEMLGGKSYTGLPYKGDDIDRYYYINKVDNYINSETICNTLFPPKKFQIFILEDFLEINPYKVGDKVIHDGEVLPIIGMKWDFSRNIVIYTMKYNYGEIDCYDSTWMRPYKEETMEEIKIDIPKGYEFAGVNDDEQQVVFTKIQPQYPKTYEECCEVLGIGSYFEPEVRNATTEECHEFIKLIRLKRCRNAYWKIYGEQMGLDKPWEPDWNDGDEEKYCIEVRGYNVCDITYLHAHRILAFPTMELLDLFGEYFKDLIEECKELL